MKEYWSIPGPRNALSKHEGQECIGFYKHDGSNLRFEYSRKQGWYKSGTRNRLFDETDNEYGRAIEIFNNTHAEGLEKVFRDKYPKFDRAIVYCEFFGPNSFAGWHCWTDQFELKLFDVDIHKRGFVLPREFVENFGHLNTPEVLYEGPFNQELVDNVKENYLGEEIVLEEGIVIKGGATQHKFWMAKIKTKWWLNELKKKAEKIDSLKSVLLENEREQS